jgi:hypothetical protein
MTAKERATQLRGAAGALDRLRASDSPDVINDVLERVRRTVARVVASYSRTVGRELARRGMTARETDTLALRGALAGLQMVDASDERALLVRLRTVKGIVARCVPPRDRTDDDVRLAVAILRRVAKLALPLVPLRGRANRRTRRADVPARRSRATRRDPAAHACRAP